MRHARADYNRIQDPEHKIPDDEPVMLFRAQDKYFIRLVQQYADWVEADGGDPKIVEACRKHVDLAEKWPVRKSPDI